MESRSAGRAWKEGRGKPSRPAPVDECLAWQHTNIQVPATNVCLFKCLLPDFSRQPVDAKWLERLLGKLTLSLQHLDWEVLAAKPFLATKQFSLADLMDSKS
ncbi:hypothetical protein CB1_001238001 [Camelus ferus]|nr:hypothetical protein CB1_001238001 [Camelus ferus]